MRKLPVNGARGKPMLFVRRRLARLAIWLQDHRRSRVANGVPGAPQDLNGTDTGSSVQLSWSSGTGTVTGLRVYRRVGAGPDTLYATLGSAALSYEDFSATIGQNYTYTVVAYNTVGESGHSNSYVTLFGS